MRNKSQSRIRPLLTTTRLGFLLFVVASLAACGTTKLPGSATGLCDIIPKAEYAVKGVTQYDQDFVDEAVTAGATCGHPAPKARPAEWDTARPKAPSAAKGRRTPKPGLVSRIRDAIIPRAHAAPPPLPAERPASLPAADPPPVIEAKPEPKPEPKPLAPVDELLGR